jgi:hypothetical protein
MASTYSDLKIELIGTGEQAGTWGTTTNTNLGTALQEAITGSADVAFSSGDVTLTLTNSNAAQIGRNLRLNLTGTSGGARNLILGSEMQVEKLYLINNTLADAVTVKNTTGTGIAVPAGKTMFVFNNGTNVVDAIDNLPSGATVGGVAISTASGTVTSVDVSGGTTGLTTSGGPVTSSGTITIAGTLAVANGGTGITSLGTGVATFLGTPSSANLAAAVTDETGSGSLVFATSPTLVTPALGTPASGTLTNATGLPISTGVSGLGTNVATFLGTPSSSNLAAAVTGETGSGALVFATSPTLVTPALGTPSSGTLTNATGLPLSTGVTGLLPVANGGTATATPSLVAGSNVTVSGTWPNQTIAASNPGGTVTSVSGTGTVQGLSLSGTVTSSGNLTLGGTLSAVNLTSQVTGTLPVANGGTGATSLTANNVILGNGTSAVQVVAPSTSGNVLTSNGTTWTSAAAPGGGSWIFLSSVTASSSATVDIETTFNSTYDNYAIVARGIQLGTDSTQFYMRTKTAGSYLTAGYSFHHTKLAMGSTSYSANASSGDSQIEVMESGSNDSDRHLDFVMYVYIPSSTTLRKYFTWQGFHGRPPSVVFGGGQITNTTALTGVRFFASSGNIAIGTFRLYGIANS